jgi:hypothetical protein
MFLSLPPKSSNPLYLLFQLGTKYIYIYIYIYIYEFITWLNKPLYKIKKLYYLCNSLIKKKSKKKLVLKNYGESLKNVLKN